MGGTCLPDERSACPISVMLMIRLHTCCGVQEKDDMGVLEDGTITPVADSELFRKNYQFVSDARKEEIYRSVFRKKLLAGSKF